MTHAEKIAALRTMLGQGRLHHATHRNSGPGLWNGLWIYESAPDGFRGYKPAFCFFDSDGRSQQDEAYEIVRHTGVSVGSFGQG